VTAEKEAVAAKQEALATLQFLTEDLLFQATPEQNSREKQLTLEQGSYRSHPPAGSER